MTTAVGPQPGGYPRHSTIGRYHRRKRAAEKMLAALVLLVAFAVTLVLLGLQWLGNQSSASSVQVTGNALISEVHAA